MTLVELIVVLAIMATMATVVGLTLNATRPGRAETDEQRMLSLVSSIRERALRSGRPVHVVATIGAAATPADSARARVTQRIEMTALPDGRIIADPAVGIERLTGHVRQGGRTHAP